jgi:hypothetical protein
MRILAACLTISAAHGAVFSDFESPTFTADTELNGQGGWTTTIGSPVRGRVTPAFDADLAQNINTVLDGSQSVYVKSAVHAVREWNGLESYVGDGLEISWLMQVDGLTRTEMYLSPDVAGLFTPIGVKFQSDGDIIAATPNSGFVDTGEDYLADKTYKFTMRVDFTAGTVAFSGRNLTDGGGVIDLGTGNTGSISSNDYQSGGGLIFLERDGAHAFYDSIELSNTNLPAAPVAFTNVIAEDVVVMAFDSTTGFTYRLDASNDLLNPDFQPTGANLEGNGQPLNFHDSAASSTSRSYRIVVIDAPSSGPNLGILEPVTGATWKVGSEHHITWDTESFSPGDTVALAYSVNGGASWDTIAADAPAPSGRYLWTVPDAIGSNVLVRLSFPGTGEDIRPFEIIASSEVDYAWTLVAANNAAFPGGDGRGALVHSNRMWLLGGWNPADTANYPRVTSNDIWSTGDGTNWVLEKPNTYDATWNPTADWEGRHTAGNAAYEGALWVLGGDANQGHYQNDVWKSSDGANWTKVDDPVPWADRVLHHAVTFDGRIWVMGGQSMPLFVQGPDVFYRDIWTTTNGTDWTQVIPAEPYWSARGMICGQAVFNNRIWILGGGRYDTPTKPREYYNDVWSSADGIHWDLHTADAPWHPRQYHSVVTFDNRLWVIEGYRQPQEMNDVWYSDDGENWYSLPFVPFNPRHASSVFSFNNEMWYVSGLESWVYKLERSAPPGDARQVIRMQAEGFDDPILLFVFDSANPVLNPHRLSLFPGGRKMTVWDSTFLLSYYDGVVSNNARFTRDPQDVITFTGWENGGNGYDIGVDMNSTPLPTITLILTNTP